MSECNEIAAALALAQTEMKNPALDAFNPHFKSKFANLASVRNAVIPVLAKHGLFLAQNLTNTDRGIACTTIITHKSGQQMTFGPLEMPSMKADAQGLGSAATYARRYALMAALCIVGDVDDDAEGATDHSDEEPLVSKLRINKIAKALMEAVHKQDGPGLLEVHDELTNNEKLAVWPQLRSDERSALKKLLAEAKAAADPNYIAPLDDASEKDQRRTAVRSAT